MQAEPFQRRVQDALDELPVGKPDEGRHDAKIAVDRRQSRQGIDFEKSGMALGVEPQVDPGHVEAAEELVDL